MPWHYDNPFFQAAPPSEKVDLDEFYKDKTKEDIVTIAEQFYAGSACRSKRSSRGAICTIGRARTSTPSPRISTGRATSGRF